MLGGIEIFKKQENVYKRELLIERRGKFELLRDLDYFIKNCLKHTIKFTS